MKNVKYYRVAGLDFRLLLPGGMDADELLPSFRNFKTMDGGSLIFSFNAAEGIPEGLGGRKLDESDTDLGLSLIHISEPTRHQ